MLMNSLLISRVNLCAIAAVWVVLSGCGTAPIATNSAVFPPAKPIDSPFSVYVPEGRYIRKSGLQKNDKKFFIIHGKSW